MSKRSLLAALAAVFLFIPTARSQDDGFSDPLIQRSSLEICRPPACEPETSTIDEIDDEQVPEATDPIEIDPLPELLGEQIRRLRELLLKLHFTNCWGLSRGKVWDILQDWLEGLRLQNVPGDLQVLDPAGNRGLIQDFLRRLKDFLKTKRISDLRNLLNKLKTLFAKRTDILEILNQILSLIQGLDNNAQIPQCIIDLLHDLIRDLIFEPVLKAAAARPGAINLDPCVIPAEDPMIASVLN
ncbi:MAG: hypothetical protein RL417_587 [Pseudomonadota bacterium]